MGSRREIALIKLKEAITNIPYPLLADEFIIHGDDASLPNATEEPLVYPGSYVTFNGNDSKRIPMRIVVLRYVSYFGLWQSPWVLPTNQLMTQHLTVPELINDSVENTHLERVRVTTA